MVTGAVGASARRRGEISPRLSPPLLQQSPTPPPQFSTTIYRVILFAVAIGVIYLVLDQSDFATPLVQISPSSSTPEVDDSTFQVFKSADLMPQKQKKQENNVNKLECILRKASMKDEKTVIVTTINAAWTEPLSIFDLFLEGLQIGNHTQKFLDNLVVVAFDEEAYSRCLSVHRHCYALLNTDGVDFSGEARFMSIDYLNMMWRRIDFLRSVLEMGYNFIFSDADIVWLRDPFERFYSNGDFQIACDVYLGSSTNRRNYPNGGFVYVKSNHRTIQFYKYWYSKRDTFPGYHDQDVFNKIKFDSFIDQIGLDIRFLDTAYFGGFCESSKDLHMLVTMHANCCTKMESKINDLRMVIQNWKKFKMARNVLGFDSSYKCSVNESQLRAMKALARG